LEGSLCGPAGARLAAQAARKPSDLLDMMAQAGQLS